ncbi:NAD(P)/FAD-dependent oxidoreductase [Miltoncostaea marina]|uniref:NAD(P)/FAD-dependent oxidoreductase n=1 Tax=Miltoncostaea marina TaxID=2843215 RepID=UPI001C3C4EBF|nr:NAD(P)/FAD-dependent oxidoreductase [Miltoncostaea marina]
MSEPARHRVVVVGGGFGGLRVAQRLRRAPVDVTLIDRRNFHLFQPLLYQVATGALSPGEIASPLRGVLKNNRNATVVLAEVDGFDVERRLVHICQVGGERPAKVPYDTLVVAAGARHSYFGHDEWAVDAPGLKSLEDALELRRRILTAFEAAELEPDPDVQRALLTFVVVGAGPTGVELAGQIAEIARDTVRRDFRHIDPARSRVVLVEGADRVLLAFPDRLSEKGEQQLTDLGVIVRRNRLVTGVDPEGVWLTGPGSDGETERLDSRTIVWAAGVQASPLARMLAEQTGAEVDRAGRMTVEPDLTVPGHPEIFALGDMVRVSDGQGGHSPVPGVAPAAIQEGKYAAKVIRARLAGDAPPPAFRYRDKGNLATIGRRRAVGQIRGVQLSGTLAWLGWLFIHLFYLTGLQNRILVFIRWTISFLTRGRGARLITGGQEDPLASPQPAPPRDAAVTAGGPPPSG